MRSEKSEELGLDSLKSSSVKIGQLYPILVDYYGNIVDGDHRLSADKNWKRVRLEHIKTEKDRLIARIVSNNVRRSVSIGEKKDMLGSMGEILLGQGIVPGKITYEIVKETGMSYRWVTKYLPDRFKDSSQSDKRRGARLQSVAHHASMAGSFADPPEGFLNLIAYKNTDFVNIIVKKCYFEKLEKRANVLGTTPIKLIYNAIQLILRTADYIEEKTKATPDTPIIFYGAHVYHDLDSNRGF